MEAVLFGADELVALAEGLGESSFPGVDEQLLGAPPPEARAAALRAGQRALLAHGALRPVAAGRWCVAPELAPLLATIMQPRLVVNLDRRTRAGRQVFLYSAHHELSVEMSATPMGVYCLLPLPTTELADRVVQRSELAERPEFESATFQLTSRQVARLREVRGQVPIDVLSELPGNAVPFARAWPKGMVRRTSAVSLVRMARSSVARSPGSTAATTAYGASNRSPLRRWHPTTALRSRARGRPTTARRLRDDFLTLLPRL